jgi:hypothetical protein
VDDDAADAEEAAKEASLQQALGAKDGLNGIKYDLALTLAAVIGVLAGCFVQRQARSRQHQV